MAKVAIIPGDGVGKEVIGEAVRVLEAVNRARCLDLELVPFDYGADRYLRDGVTLPEEQFADFREDYDAILLGAIGDPRVPDNRHGREILLGLRFKLDLYINLRPVQLLDERLCPLKGKSRQGHRLHRLPREHRGALRRRRRHLQEGHARRDRRQRGRQHPQRRRAHHPRGLRVRRWTTARSASA